MWVIDSLMAESPPSINIPGAITPPTLPPIESATPPKAPILYFNGFALAFGNSDITIKLNLENMEVLELKASYTTAKTLASGLAQMMEQFERVTNHTVMVIDEVGTKMMAAQSGAEKPRP